MKKMIRYGTALVVLLSVASFEVSAHGFEIGNITIVHPWARASAGHMKTGAAYIREINITGDTADRLIGVSTPVAKKASVHNNVMEDGIMKMLPVKALEINPGVPTVLKPGGLHIMLMGLHSPLKAGETFPMTLVFEKAGQVEVWVKIGKIADMGGQTMPGHMSDMADHMSGDMADHMSGNMPDHATDHTHKKMHGSESAHGAQ